MKALFIIQPVIGRNIEDIRASAVKMQRIAEATIGEEMKPLQNYEDGDEELIGMGELFLTGCYLSNMRYADYVISIEEQYQYRITEILYDAAKKFGIPIITCKTKFVCPDEIPQEENAVHIPWEDDLK